ncbi:carbohydrate esterase family 3 protein [Xylariaceae sp. FL0255]|nr:carbohydrate esterase family 3 protein [Xylariaceae sp. FL0255]
MGFLNSDKALQPRKILIWVAVLLITISLFTGFASSRDVFNSVSSSRTAKPATPPVTVTVTATVTSTPTLSLAGSNISHILPPLPSQTALGGGVPLRVMFLGASVTRGDVSTGNLGFRKPLRDKLTALGNPVNYVGSERLGDFKDNDIEAFKGNRIDQIHAHSFRIVPETRPNVFVLHVGSNDCLQKHNTAEAGKRMRDLINYLLVTSPRATVVMSTLLTNTVKGKEECILDINVQIRKLASELEREGRPVVLAEMHCEQGLPNRPLPGDISSDGTHPHDRGYGLMADIFYDAFLAADERHFFKQPEDNGIPDDGELERANEPDLFVPEPPKEKPKTEPPKTEPPKTDPPKTEPPKTEPPKEANSPRRARWRHRRMFG